MVEPIRYFVHKLTLLIKKKMKRKENFCTVVTSSIYFSDVPFTPLLFCKLIFFILQFIEEAERSLHDAIMIVRRAMKNSTVVAGGGAIDVSVFTIDNVFDMYLDLVDVHILLRLMLVLQMEISRFLRQHARTIAGKSQLFINSYAKALEVCIFDSAIILSCKGLKHFCMLYFYLVLCGVI